MAGLGLVEYGGSDEEDDDVKSEVSGGATGVVLLGAYADPASRQGRDAAQPSGQPGTDSGPHDGSEPMAVDTEPSGASLSHRSHDKSAAAGMTPQSGAAVDEEVTPGLPPELLQPPPGQPDPELAARVESFLKSQRNLGLRVKTELRKARGYRNPDFLRDMTEKLGVQEYGSNFPKDIFDPDNLHEEDFYESLRKAWDAEQDRRAKERQASGRVEFTKPSAASSGPPARAGAALPGGGSVAAVAAKARAQAVAAAALKGKGSRWG